MALRVAVIGCGAIARQQHIPALLAAGARLTHFASHSLASAEAARDAVGSGEATADWREVLASGEVDAVTICTPNALHAEVAIAAAAAGKHVLVEKPFATMLAEADAMIAAATAAGTVLMAAHNVRFAAPFAPMRAAVARGDIGTPTSARVVFCHAGPQAWSPASTWFRDPGLAGGGALMDLGVHVVDTLRYLLDDEIVEVSATTDALPIDEDAHVTFRTRRGLIGAFHAGWRSTAGPDQSVVINGTAGAVAFDATSGLRHLRPDTPPEAIAMDGPADDPCAAFVRAIVEGAPATPSATDGRAAVAVIEAAYRSAGSGQSEGVTA